MQLATWSLAVEYYVSNLTKHFWKCHFRYLQAVRISCSHHPCSCQALHGLTVNMLHWHTRWIAGKESTPKVWQLFKTYMARRIHLESTCWKMECRKHQQQQVKSFWNVKLIVCAKKSPESKTFHIIRVCWSLDLIGAVTTAEKTKPFWIPHLFGFIQGFEDMSPARILSWVCTW